MKRTIFSSVACAALAFAVTGVAQDKPSQTTSHNASGGPLSAADQQFIMEAAKGGMMEVEMGKVAAKNATSAEVKNFGNTMVTDHTKANTQLKSIAARKNVKLPGKPTAEAWKSDKDYMKMMVEDHTKDLAEFEKEAKTTNDPELKQFARSTSVVVRNHLNMAKKIAATMK